LLKYISETGKYVEITGFRNVKIKDAEEFVEAARKETVQNVWVQFFDAELVATWQHLYFAVLNGMLAFENGRNISKSVAMEVLLYASAQRQIRKSLQIIGVKRDSANVAMILVGDNAESVKTVLSAVSKRIGTEPCEAPLEVSEEKLLGIREAFGITGREIETIMEKRDVKQALVKLVIERMALLSTQL
jgi:tRNA threonylcarbamoyladenosine modification (KEOPS) complex Cgi121 subunit